MSKRSAKSNAHDFYDKNFNHNFLQKPELKKMMSKEIWRWQSTLDVNEHQMPDHPSAFMKMIKVRENAISSANNERSQALNPCVIWAGNIDQFEVLEMMLKVNMEKLVHDTYSTQNFRMLTLREVQTVMLILDEVLSASQIKKDAHELYGALLNACKGGVGRRILMERRNEIRVLYPLVNQYETDGNRNLWIKKLENVITTVFHRNNKGGLMKSIQDYEDAFTELVLLGQKTWDEDDMKKCQSVKNAKNIGMVDTVFE
jgi:hypothetical protein